MIFISVIYVFTQLMNLAFNLNKYRKANYLIGSGLAGLNWLGMAISYYFGSFGYPKLSGFVLAIAAGCFIPTSYCIMAEVCGANLVSYSLLANLLTVFICNYIGPYILTSNDVYGYWCAGNAFLCLSATLFCWFYLIETHGLETKDIFDL